MIAPHYVLPQRRIVVASYLGVDVCDVADEPDEPSGSSVFVRITVDAYCLSQCVRLPHFLGGISLPRRKARPVTAIGLPRTHFITSNKAVISIKNGGLGGYEMACNKAVAGR